MPSFLTANINFQTFWDSSSVRSPELFFVGIDLGQKEANKQLDYLLLIIKIKERKIIETKRKKKKEMIEIK